MRLGWLDGEGVRVRLGEEGGVVWDRVAVMCGLESRCDGWKEKGLE